MVGVLIEYYKKIKKDAMNKIGSVEVSIENNMDNVRSAEITPVVKRFQEIMERGGM